MGAFYKYAISEGKSRCRSTRFPDAFSARFLVRRSASHFHAIARRPFSDCLEAVTRLYRGILSSPL